MNKKSLFIVHHKTQVLCTNYCDTDLFSQEVVDMELSLIRIKGICYVGGYSLWLKQALFS